MNDISVCKITFGEEIYNAILVNTKIKYFVQGKCLLLILFYLPFSRQCILSVAIKTKSYLDSCDSICEEENN